MRACSTWKAVHESLQKAKKILENNQYPPSFYDPIIKKVLVSIMDKPDEQEETKDDKEKEHKMLFVQYRGKLSEKFEKTLKHINAPYRVIFTIRKLKTVLPSLKSQVDKALKSGIVYKISCSRCKSCYVGQTI